MRRIGSASFGRVNLALGLLGGGLVVFYGWIAVFLRPSVKYNVIKSSIGRISGIVNGSGLRAHVAAVKFLVVQFRAILSVFARDFFIVEVVSRDTISAGVSYFIAFCFLHGFLLVVMC